MPSRKKKTSIKGPKRPPLGKQLRSNSIVLNDPPTTPLHIYKAKVYFDKIQVNNTKKKKQKSNYDKPPKLVQLTQGLLIIQQLVTISQAYEAIENLEEIKKKVADKVITKYIAQLDA